MHREQGKRAENYAQRAATQKTHHSGSIDVVGVGAVDHGVEDDPVVVEGELVRVAVLLLVLRLEGDRRGARLGLVAAEGDPLLLQTLLVLQVVLHVGEHHVAGRDVHVRGVRLLRPVVRKRQLFFMIHLMDV